MGRRREPLGFEIDYSMSSYLNRTVRSFREVLLGVNTL